MYVHRSSASSSCITSGPPASPKSPAEFPVSSVCLLRCLDEEQQEAVAARNVQFGPTYIGHLNAALDETVTQTIDQTTTTPALSQRSLLLAGNFQQKQNRVQPVLVRMLAPDADLQRRVEFWDVVVGAATMTHPNVTALVGVIGSRQEESSPPLRSSMTAALFELGDVAAEDLRHFLVRRYTNSRRIPNGTGNVSDAVKFCGAGSPRFDTFFGSTTVVNIALQIAAGLRYLHNRGIVHGDLAARNCLVVASETHPGDPRSTTIVIKVGAGLAAIGRVLYPADYAPIGSGGAGQLLPVRWMSPETLIHSGVGPPMRLTGDVWAYGVTLWEVCTAGCRPYGGLSDHEVVELVGSGRLQLSSPSSSMWSSEATSGRRRQTLRVIRLLYTIMSECWQTNPTQRPTADQVFDRLMHINGGRSEPEEVQFETINGSVISPSATSAS
jgi:serine/threonine protein kinase